MRTAAFLLLATLTTFVVTSSIGTRSARAGSNPADDKKEDKVAAELKKFAGTWAIESATLYGRPLTKLEPGVRYEFKDSTLKNFVLEQPDATGYRIVGLDLSKDPKRMTLTQAEMKDGRLSPVADGEVVRAVYALEADKLTVVQWKGKTAEFPRSVKPEDGDPVMVLVLKRVKN